MYDWKTDKLFESNEVQIWVNQLLSMENPEAGKAGP